MAMINQLKFALRKGLGVTELREGFTILQERVEHLARQNREIKDHNNVLESQLRDTLDYNHRIFNHIEQLLDQQKRQLLQEIIHQNQPGSILSCRINYCEILAPVELLKLCAHCLHPTTDKKLNYFVETHCVDWLFSHLKSGDTVLDIGASFGTVSLPLAKVVGDKGHIYAFEPARKTQQFLQQIIELNDINNISVVKSAVSDEPGTAQFVEYTDTDSFSWASDTSALNSPAINTQLKHLVYDVPITTIDDFVITQNLQPKAIKIDIEGFELYALYGAKSTLTKYTPYLSIDIHKDIKTGQSALLEVKPFLNALGYHTELKEHTLFCTPIHK